MTEAKRSTHSFTAISVPLIVLLLAVTARAIVHSQPSLQALANVSALPAIAFAAGYLLRRWWAPLIVVAAMVGVDAWIDAGSLATYWPAIFGAYALFLLFGWWGLRLPKQTSNLGVLGRSAITSGVFYLVTNTISSLSIVGYERSLAGWIQAQTMGLPGLRPTWSFGLQMLVSTLVFTAVILVLFRRQSAWLPRKLASEPVSTAVPAHR